MHLRYFCRLLLCGVLVLHLVGLLGVLQLVGFLGVLYLVGLLGARHLAVGILQRVLRHLVVGISLYAEQTNAYGDPCGDASPKTAELSQKTK